MDARWRHQLLIVALALVCMVVALWLPQTWWFVRLPAAVCLALLLPGYTLTSLLFPSHSLEVADQALCVICLGLVMQIGLALALNMTPWGLAAVPWTISTTALVVLLSGAVCFRSTPATPRGTGRSGKGLLLGASFLPAVLIAATAIGLARYGAQIQPRPGFTELWLTAQPGDPHAVSVGVLSHEGATVAYHLELVQGKALVLTSLNFSLAPGETYETDARLLEGDAPPDVEAYIYLAADRQHPYRHVYLHREGK